MGEKMTSSGCATVTLSHVLSGKPSQQGMGSHLAYSQAACLTGEALQKELGQAQRVWGMTTEPATVLRATPQIDLPLSPNYCESGSPQGPGVEGQ